MLKGLGMMVMFFSIFPVGDLETRRRKRVDQENDWLHDWYHTKSLSFYNLRHTFKRLDMLTPDGAHWTNSVLVSKLSGPSRALNKIQQGMGMPFSVSQKNQETLTL